MRENTAAAARAAPRGGCPMSPASRWLLVPALLAGGLGPARPAQAAAPRVFDEAKVFSPDAVAKADRAVKELAREYHVPVIIDTVPRIPDDLQAKYKEEGKAKFF